MTLFHVSFASSWVALLLLASTSFMPGRCDVPTHVAVSCGMANACTHIHHLLMHVDKKHTMVLSPTTRPASPTSTAASSLWDLVLHLYKYTGTLKNNQSSADIDKEHLVFLNGKTPVWTNAALKATLGSLDSHGRGAMAVKRNIATLEQHSPSRGVPCACSQGGNPAPMYSMTRTDTGTGTDDIILSVSGKVTEVYKFAQAAYTCAVKKSGRIGDDAAYEASYDDLCQCFRASYNLCEGCTFLTIHDLQDVISLKRTDYKPIATHVSANEIANLAKQHTQQLGQQYTALGQGVYAVTLYKDPLRGSKDHASKPWPVGDPDAMNQRDQPAKHVKHVIGVMCRYMDHAGRGSIRSTFMRYPNVYHHAHNPHGSVQVVFVLGRVHYSEIDQLLLEYLRYRDLVVLDQHENMNDGKTIWWFTWAWSFVKDSNVLAVAKADMDTFVRTVVFEQHATALIARYGYNYSNLYWGKMHYRTSEVAKHVRVTQGMVCYANGRFVVLGLNLVKDLANSQVALLYPSNSNPKATWEDYWVGVLLHNSTEVVVPRHEDSAELNRRFGDAPEDIQDLVADSIIVHHVKRYPGHYLYWDVFQPI